jgi:hypothetical protein
MTRYVTNLGGQPAAFALGLALAVGMSCYALAQPKEGTYKGSYTAFGTVKAVAVGKDRILLFAEENGASVTDGFLDHVTWRCWGVGSYVNGMGEDRGYCVGTDHAGDQIVDDFTTEPHKLGEATVKGADHWTGGSGKYAGVTGGGPWTADLAFKTTNEGAYVVHIVPFQGSYKLP